MLSYLKFLQTKGEFFIMRKSIIISFALLLISCSNSSQTSSEEKAASYNNLSVDEVITLWQSNPDIIVIDVRTPEEIAEIGTIEGSTNIDFKAADFKEKVSSLDKAKNIYYSAEQATALDKLLK